MGYNSLYAILLLFSGFRIVQFCEHVEFVSKSGNSFCTAAPGTRPNHYLIWPLCLYPYLHLNHLHLECTVSRRLNIYIYMYIYIHVYIYICM